MVAQLEGRTILVVDDDPDVVASIETVLRDTGAEIVTARDGSAAVELATTRTPDLVVLDALLP
jgi:CheY-like chemotaxis protein